MTNADVLDQWHTIASSLIYSKSKHCISRAKTLAGFFLGVLFLFGIMCTMYVSPFCQFMEPILIM